MQTVPTVRLADTADAVVLPDLPEGIRRAMAVQPFRARRELLTTIAGIGPFAAAAIISEAGADIGETFPSAGHFASWIGVCPGNHESAGKRHSGKPERETSICSTSSSNARGPRRA